MHFPNRITLKFIASLSCLLLSHSLVAEESDAALVSVKSARQQQVSPTVWLAGNVVNRLSAQLSAEQNGKLVWILDVGHSVNKGEPVARLDDRELKLQVAEKSAQLRRQVANINYLEKQQTRLNLLLTNNSTAKIELDRIDRDLTVAKEEMNALEIQIKQIELAIEKTILRAPFSGKINARMAQTGEYVSAGVSLVQLIDPVKLDISVAAPLSLAPFLSQQNEVLVKWDNQLQSLPIRSWSPAGDQSSRTFDVRLDASSLALLGGSGVSVSLPSDKVTDATLVPRDALVLRDRQTYVVTIDKQKAAHRISVNVGRGVGDWVSVEGSLGAGDQVVIRGGERLEDGQKVRIMPLEVDDSSAIAAY